MPSVTLPGESCSRPGKLPRSIPHGSRAVFSCLPKYQAATAPTRPPFFYLPAAGGAQRLASTRPGAEWTLSLQHCPPPAHRWQARSNSLAGGHRHTRRGISPQRGAVMPPSRCFWLFLGSFHFTQQIFLAIISTTWLAGTFIPLSISTPTLSPMTI